MRVRNISRGEDGYILGRRCGSWLRLARMALARGGIRTGSSRHVAFAIRNRQIISIGINSYRKTHPKQRSYARNAGQPLKEYLHAEIAALVAARCPVDSIIVLRLNANNELASSCPCRVCSLAISLAGVTNIYHS